MMTRPLIHYAFRTYTGPTIVDIVGKRLAAVPGPGPLLVCVGTEHIHYAVHAADRDSAERIALTWWHAADCGWMAARYLELLWSRPIDGK